MKAKPIVRALFIAGLSAAVATGCSSNAVDALLSTSRAATPEHQVPTRPLPVQSSSAAALPDFSTLVDKYGPAVVNISVTETVKTSGTPFPNLDRNDPFWQFFKDLPFPKTPQSGLMRGLGSGFIVSPDGVILTNAHVVDNAKEVMVKLTDRREFKAKVVGKDDQSDVAVIKIDAHDLPTVKLGDSSNIRVGEWVVAIGAPFGFDNSVTAGIVSAKARSLGESYVPFLQTDVPVNPGNSGGPLFDLKGEVVGINSQIYSRSGGFQGVSFAIPINLAAKVESQLLASGHVTRGRLGVAVQEVSQGLADSFGLKSPEGALVGTVDPDGPAAKAGVKSGDVILKLNGEDVEQSTDLPVRVAQLKPGTKATLELWRDGKARDVTVTIGEFKNQNETVATASQSSSDYGRLGVAVRPLTKEERQQANVESGLLVTESSGAAAQAGIEPGDIIVGVNNTPVSNVRELRSMLAKAGKHVALLVQHGEATIFVPIDLG